MTSATIAIIPIFERRYVAPPIAVDKRITGRFGLCYRDLFGGGVVKGRETGEIRLASLTEKLGGNAMG